MPSVAAMRRSTRVFVPKSVKDVEGATVLRSGKRLSSPLFVDLKTAGGNENEWFPLSMVERSCGVVATSLHNKSSVVKRNEVAFKPEISSELKKLYVTGTVKDEPKKNKMYGNGYGRKRLRSVAENVVGTLTESNKKLGFDFEKRGLEERRYGIHFVRNHPRKAISSESSAHLAIEHYGGSEFSKFNSESEDLAGKSVSLSSESRETLDVIVEPSPCCSIQFSIFLVSLLNYMRRARVIMSKLIAFMCSEPIGEAFSRHGIHFFPDLSCRRSGTLLSRICRVWGAQDFVPMFSLNFNSAPFTFISLHFRMLLRSQSLMGVFERYLKGLVMKPHGANGSRKRLSSEMGVSLSKIVASVSSSAKRRKGVNFVDKAVPFSQRRISIRRNSRNVKTFKSLRFKSPPTLVLQECADEVSDMFGTGVDSADTSSENKVKKPLPNGHCSTDIIKETNQKMDTICCSANVLVTESDKCYRAGGGKIMLEYSESDDWLLVVKVQGLTRFTHKAIDLMRPLCTTNRFTHDLIWIGRTDWRLEFSERQDWAIFKELHSECADRNMKAMAAREVVPVPGAHEVESHGDYKNVPFVRPNAYIKMHGNEVERLLARRTANYEIDSDDEEWLGKLNNDLCGDGGSLRLVSAENFEKMVDIFEKAAYCKPDDISDESRAIRLCPDMKMNIFTAVYHYWVEKRKRKNCALLRVLQCAPPRKHEVLQKPFLRKKRSLKRQSSKCGKGKPRTFFQVFAEEQEQDAIHRVEEAKHSARVSVELAVVKRKRAQERMEVADLATYKATLALKIAEAVQHEIPSNDFVAFILS